MNSIQRLLVIFSLTAPMLCVGLPKKENPKFQGCDFTFSIEKPYYELRGYDYLRSKDPKIKVYPATYTDLSEVSEDWIRAKKGGKFGFIDINDNLVFDFELRLVSDYHDGYAVYRSGDHLRDPKSYIDKKGNFLGDLVFDEAYIFRNGFAIIKDDGKYGVIDTKGKFVIPKKYDALSELYNGWASFKREEHQGLVNSKGIEKKFIHDDYDIKPFIYNKGHLLFSHYKKVGLMDSDFKVIIPPKYDYLGSIQEGFIRFQINKKWGFLDTTGKIIIEPIYDSVGDFKEGYATIEINKKDGKIGKNGEYLIEPNLAYIGLFDDGIALAKENDSNGYGYITVDAEWLVPPIFENLTSIKDGIFNYQLNGKWGFVNLRECLHK
ncbi:WG repeat-containing protein [Leptospira sp. 96542]|nr:WG repeat-containing protein [Leptospira sp. 96542]